MPYTTTERPTVAILASETSQTALLAASPAIEAWTVHNAENLYKHLLTEKADIFLMLRHWHRRLLKKHLEIITHLVNTYSEQPVMAICQETDNHHAILALKSGAERCLYQPMTEELLLLNIDKALQKKTLSHAYRSTDSDSGTWQLDLQRWTLISPHHIKLKLTEKEFLFIRALFTSHGNTLSKQYLWENIFRLSPTDRTQRMDMMISRLRKKAKSVFDEELPIRTAYLSGYAFTSPCQII